MTQTWYDWRDRPVATKAGCRRARRRDATGRSSSPPTTTSDEVTRGAAVRRRRVIADGRERGAGAAGRPAALLRAQAATAYDEQGRVYQTQMFSVDPVRPGRVSAVRPDDQHLVRPPRRRGRRAGPGRAVDEDGVRRGGPADGGVRHRRGRRHGLRGRARA